MVKDNTENAQTRGKVQMKQDNAQGFPQSVQNIQAGPK